VNKKLEECPICLEISLLKEKRDYLANWKKNEIIVPNIEIQKCQKCGEEIIDFENAKKIDNFIITLKPKAS